MGGADDGGLVRVDRPALVAVTVAALVVGVAPYVFFVERWWLFAMTAGLAAVGAIPSARSHVTRASRAPGGFEWLLGGTAALGTGAVLAFLGVVSHWIVSHAVLAIDWTAGWLGHPIGLGVRSRDAIAFGVSASLVALTAFSSGVTACQELARRLYPRTAGLESAFYAQATYAREKALRVLVFAAVALGVGALVAGLGPDLRSAWWFAVAWAWFLAIAGLTVGDLGRSEPAADGGSASVAGVQELFEAAGYEVVVSPRTERDDLDPLLVDCLDLYAERGGRGFAIDVWAEGEQGAEPEQLAAPGITTAAWALETFFREGADASEKGTTATREVPVEPVVVTVGGRPSRSIQVAALRGDLRIVEIEDAASLRRLVGVADPAERRRRARVQLRVLERGGEDADSEPEETAPGTREAVEAP